MSKIVAMTIHQYQLYTLRCAAEEWLKDHPNDPNAAVVKSALIATTPDNTKENAE